MKRSTKCLLLPMVLCIALCIGFCNASRAAEAPPPSLDELTAQAEVVLKVTALGTEPLEDPWFPAGSRLNVCTTRFKVISVIKGEGFEGEVKFRHYEERPPNPLRNFFPAPRPRFNFANGQHYLLWANKIEGGELRQLSKDIDSNIGPMALRVGDDAPVQGGAGDIKNIVWNELTRATHSPQGLHTTLYWLSWRSGADLPRWIGDARNPRPEFSHERYVREVLLPLLNSPDDRVVITALNFVVGNSAQLAEGELLKMAQTHRSVPLRGVALSCLGGTKSSAAQEAAHRALQAYPPANTSSDAAVVQSCALSLLAEFPGERSRFAWRAYAAHPQERVRQSVASAIGNAQEGALAWLLDKMMNDSNQFVRENAFYSLMALPPAHATRLWKKRLAEDDYRPYFINALAARNAAPYLRELTRVLSQELRPAQLLNLPRDNSPARRALHEPLRTSWHLLFDYLLQQPPSKLRAAHLTPVLDALQYAPYLGDAEARTLYKFFRTHHMAKRARDYREDWQRNASLKLSAVFQSVDRELSKKAPTR